MRQRIILISYCTKTTTKKNLFVLADLETSIVYLVAAAKQNRMLLEHIKGHAVYRHLDEIEKSSLTMS